MNLALAIAFANPDALNTAGSPSRQENRFRQVQHGNSKVYDFDALDDNARMSYVVDFSIVGFIVFFFQ